MENDATAAGQPSPVDIIIPPASTEIMDDVFASGDAGATTATDNTIAIEMVMRSRIEDFKRVCFLLKENKENRYYKTQGYSWNEYVASVGLTLTKANKMVRFASLYGAALQQADDKGVLSLGCVDEDRLLNGWMPLVKYDKNTDVVEDIGKVVELLGQATTLSYSDFQAVKDQHVQTKQHPEVQPALLSEGPVLDENKNVVGNYRTRKATGKQHFFTIGIQDCYIKGCAGQELKVSLGNLPRT